MIEYEIVFWDKQLKHPYRSSFSDYDDPLEQVIIAIIRFDPESKYGYREGKIIIWLN